MRKVEHLFVACFVLIITASAFAKQYYRVKSPNGTIAVKLNIAEKITWSVIHKGQTIVEPSSISITLQNGGVLGENAEVAKVNKKSITSEFQALNYRKKIVPDIYNLLDIKCHEQYGIRLRVYNDAVAYRFYTEKAENIIVEAEEANFNFTKDHTAYIPYLWDYRGGHIFNASFESPYTKQNISEFATDSLAILPLMVEVGEGKKIVIMEADLENYPGMYLNLNATQKGFKGVYPHYPLKTKQGGYQNMNVIPTKRADFLAKTKGTRSFPWRVIAISEKDQELLNNDIVQKLAAPTRIENTEWIKPGQVAWDWWNNWNVYGVDFKAGINTKTYQHYIDFAAENGAKYIILDAGWSETFDLTAVNPEIDLKEIISYGKKQDVGVILWAAWYTITQQMEKVFPKYAQMGVKGWKIDFVDRDDQIAVKSTYDIAQYAAEHNLLVDYHGIFKPTGLQRTYPNVVGYEGVYGLENFKWADMNAPKYAVTIPFIRNMAGPMDYTSGAMLNVTDEAFCARNHQPLAKGTRCNQIAQYVVFEVPLQMLSDSPTLYRREQESTDFITSIPTVFDETVPLAGEVAEYVAIARRKGTTWYVGAMTNWKARKLEIDLSFLKQGQYTATIFQDGINANREATDYKKKIIEVSAQTILKVQLAQGGGWAVRIEKK